MRPTGTSITAPQVVVSGKYVCGPFAEGDGVNTPFVAVRVR